MVKVYGGCINGTSLGFLREVVACHFKSICIQNMFLDIRFS